MVARVQVKHYEPAIEWDVFRLRRWIGTVRAPRTNDVDGTRDAHALARAKTKFTIDAITVIPRQGA